MEDNICVSDFNSFDPLLNGAKHYITISVGEPIFQEFKKEIKWPETEEERLHLAREIVKDINSKDLGFRAKLVENGK